MKKPLFDFKHPFFKPLWVRTLTFAICMGWGLLEFSVGSLFWGGLFWGLGLLAGYNFFIADNFSSDETE